MSKEVMPREKFNPVVERFIQYHARDMYMNEEDFIRVLDIQLSQVHHDGNKHYLLERTRQEVEQMLLDHESACRTDSNKCGVSRSLSACIGYIDDRQTVIHDSIFRTSFTEDQIKILQEQSDVIHAKLNELQVGQRITYDDFVEVLEEMNLLAGKVDKKSFFQLLKGKILDKTADVAVVTPIVDLAQSYLIEKLQLLG